MAVRNYVGIAERGPDGWWMSFPAFPGVTSAADVLPELLRNAPQALAPAIEAMQDDGLAQPQPRSTAPTTVIPWWRWCRSRSAAGRSAST